VAKDRPIERGDRGRAGVGSFPGRKLAGCFSQNEIAIRPRENASPTPCPAVALDGLEVDSKSLSQSIRFIDLVSR